MIGELAPPGVHTAEGKIRADAPLHPEEEALAREMSPARRAEFASARACARRALAEIGYANVAIGRGARRMPLWPPGVVGSLTHRDGRCAGAVGRAGDWLGIGIDVEPWQPLSRRALERITLPSERDALRGLSGASSERWGAALFSAKESLYKALFPQTQLFLGFRDAEITLSPATPVTGRFTAALLHRPTLDLLQRERFSGRFALDASGARIWTCLAVPR